MNNPVATITMADGRQLILELRPDAAPNTVNNFIQLANSGSYDGLTFHRIVSEFMIQGGSPTNSCAASNTFSIKGEFSSNGVDNPLRHDKGAISMARSGHPDSASMQFFIMHRAAHYLDGQYAAFGKLTKGHELLEELGFVPTDETPGRNNPPLEPVVIQTIRVELGDWNYTEPERIPS